MAGRKLYHRQPGTLPHPPSRTSLALATVGRLHDADLPCPRIRHGRPRPASVRARPALRPRGRRPRRRHGCPARGSARRVPELRLRDVLLRQLVPRLGGGRGRRPPGDRLGQRLGDHVHRHRGRHVHRRRERHVTWSAPTPSGAAGSPAARCPTRSAAARSGTGAGARAGGELASTLSMVPPLPERRPERPALGLDRARVRVRRPDAVDGGTRRALGARTWR